MNRMEEEESEEFDNTFLDEDEGLYPPFPNVDLDGDLMREATRSEASNLKTLRALRNFLNCYINDASSTEEDSNSPLKETSSKTQPKHGQGYRSSSYEQERLQRRRVVPDLSLPPIHINLLLPPESHRCSRFMDLQHTMTKDREDTTRRSSCTNSDAGSSRYVEEMQNFEKSCEKPNRLLLKSFWGEVRTNTSIKDDKERSKSSALENTHPRHPMKDTDEKTGSLRSRNTEKPGGQKNYSHGAKNADSKSKTDTQETTTLLETQNHGEKVSKAQKEKPAKSVTDGQIDTYDTSFSSLSDGNQALNKPLLSTSARGYSSLRNLHSQRNLSDAITTKPVQDVKEAGIPKVSAKLNSKFFSKSLPRQPPTSPNNNNTWQDGAMINWQYPGVPDRGSVNDRIPTPMHDDLTVKREDLLQGEIPEFTDKEFQNLRDGESLGNSAILVISKANSQRSNSASSGSFISPESRIQQPETSIPELENASTPLTDNSVPTFEESANQPWTADNNTSFKRNYFLNGEGEESSGNVGVNNRSTYACKKAGALTKYPNYKINKVYTNTWSASGGMTRVAAANGFEAHDVPADGNCMFFAIEDQLRINGDFQHTPTSIRMNAVRYLREHPTQKDGSHLMSFLSGKETWDDYLDRMSEDGEWGDHIILNSIVEILGRKIIVVSVPSYSEDVQRTELEPAEHAKEDKKPLYLGHIGEYHYLSLRPFNWEVKWPIAAKIERLDQKIRDNEKLREMEEQKMAILETLIDKPESVGQDEGVEIGASGLSPPRDEVTTEKPMHETGETDDQVNYDRRHNKSSLNDVGSGGSQDDEKLKIMTSSERDLEEPEVNKDEDDSSSADSERKDSKSRSDTDCGSSRKTTGALLFVETEDMTRWLKENRLYVDPVSQTPMPHLTFLLENSLRHSYFKELQFQATASDSTCLECVGGATDGSDVVLTNYSDSDDMKAFQQSLRKTPRVVAIADYNVKFASCDKLERRDICIVTDNVNPGYCKLRPADPTRSCWENALSDASDDTQYITNTEGIQLKVTYKGLQSITPSRMCVGFKCLEWPPVAAEWLSRERPNHWPTTSHMKNIKDAGCLLVKRSVLDEDDSDLEWMFVFSQAERYIFKYIVSSAQYHGYSMFKALIDYQLKPCAHKLKSVHLKSIFFFACEDIEEAMWQDSIGSCVMYMTSQLLVSLRSRFLPNYFMKENNMIVRYKLEALSEIIERVEPIRLFPIETLAFMAEKYGIPQTCWMRKKILDDATIFSQDSDLSGSIHRTFIPLKLKFARSYFPEQRFQEAYGIVYEAYTMCFTCPPAPDGTPPYVPDRGQFFIEFLNSIRKLEDKILFTAHLLPILGISSLSTEKGGKLIQDIVGGETLLGVEKVPIPTSYENNLASEAWLLGNLAVSFWKNEQYRESEICLKWAIKHVKRAMEEEYIDVSEITDDELKRAIGRENMKNLEKWNGQLREYYRRLKVLYTSMNRIELIRDYMEDIEQLSIRVPNLTSFVIDLWTQLGEPDRGMAIKDKSGKLDTASHESNMDERD